ncbi:hypothetical protein TWF694_007336 [Orbilia ellipsospora]|uniref:Uncharacterized protein n=1 Tax=Orbilia ellipsospora TaxID=2528407 RepID=A0AAV9XK35_9PEZI
MTLFVSYFLFLMGFIHIISSAPANSDLAPTTNGTVGSHDPFKVPRGSIVPMQALEAGAVVEISVRYKHPDLVNGVPAIHGGPLSTISFTNSVNDKGNIPLSISFATLDSPLWITSVINGARGIGPLNSTEIPIQNLTYILPNDTSGWRQVRFTVRYTGISTPNFGAVGYEITFYTQDAVSDKGIDASRGVHSGGEGRYVVEGVDFGYVTPSNAPEKDFGANALFFDADADGPLDAELSVVYLNN